MRRPCRRLRQAVVRLTMLGVMLATVLGPVSGSFAGEASPERERIEFQAALEALSLGEAALGVGLLEELAATATADWKRETYRAWAAFGRGERKPASQAVDRALAAAREPEESVWLYDQLIRLAGKLRLEEVRAEQDRRLAELMERHYAARGGLERLEAMDTLVVTGRMRIGESESPFRLFRKRPRFYRLELETPAGLEVTVSDGRGAWRIQPGQEARPLAGESLARLLRESWFDDVLVRFSESGERLTLVGEEDVEEGRALRIDATALDGTRQSVYLDGETLLETRRVVHEAVGGAPKVIAFEQREVGGVWLPSRQRVESGGGLIELTLDEYSLGDALDVELFR